ncbi:sensor protein PilS [Marinobacterium zhoushanense]|uniref:histidine kinase n=1 Tax=Marinobacterium zhoushanense TaxID=1679163 RepID=A0ABQ1K783_9GAMM|nr:ATP-binding protein [Marinobacterium zhoushanense]GGB87405.1 sensor protein PilS [Marinobacterium zhoushanense]
MSEILDWRALRVFSLYRIILSGLLVTLLIMPRSGMLPTIWQPDMFGIVALLYFVFAIGSGISVGRWESNGTQFGLQVILDLVALSLLGFSSGDPTGIYATLMLVPVCFAGFWKPGAGTQLFSAVAILGMLASTLVHQLLGTQPYPLAELGALSATQLAIALVSTVVGRNMADTRRLVGKRELDLASLTELNTFIVQRMEEGVVVVDAENVIRMINPAAGQLFGVSSSAQLHQQLVELSPALATALEHWREGKPVGSELLAPLRLQITATGPGRDERAVLLLEDIQGQNTRVQREKLAALGRLTASLAHEIRNPLGAISYSAQLLAEAPDLQAQEQKLTAIILAQSKRLNRLIEEILTLSRRKTPLWLDLQLGQWMTKLRDEWRLSWPDLAERLSLSIENGGENLQVRVDPDHLRQLLTLLLDNALKHGTPEQGVACIAIRVYRAGASATPCIEVSDNGRGIDSEMEQRIYEPFFTTRHDGSGLGLYLARELCEANYCELRYSPVQTGGSCFRITFPMERPITSAIDD